MSTTWVFIDGQNIYMGAQRLDFTLNYCRLRKYLSDKYLMERIFIFLGYLERNQKLYEYLRKCGYELVFRKTSVGQKNAVRKGNVDVLLSVFVMKHVQHFDRCILMSSDGDFEPLLKELIERGQFLRLIAPTRAHCSLLLRKAAKGNLILLEELESKLAMKKRP